MCPKLIELLSWNGPTVHVCCFMLARASTKTFVSQVKKTAKKIFVSRKIRYQGHSLAEVSLYIIPAHTLSTYRFMVHVEQFSRLLQVVFFVYAFLPKARLHFSSPPSLHPQTLCIYCCFCRLL